MEPPGDRWPEARAYFPALSNAAAFIRDERIQPLSVERGPGLGSRIPYGRSGKFGSVFKFTGDGEPLALKVFVRHAPNRQLRYRLIGDHLARAEPTTPRLISFKYDDQGIRVRGVWYPTLVMDWSSGIPLDKYLTEQLMSPPIDNARLCNEWVETVRDLRTRKIAHGDLQHENILVKDDGTFQLIDYDGMFVPEMRAYKLQAAEVGRPAYQHPARSARPYRTDYFDERLDDFSALLILLSLAAMDAPTWTTYHNDDDKLILSEEDLRKPSQSALLGELAERSGPVSTLTNMLVRATTGAIEAVPSFETVVADPDVQVLLKGPLKGTTDPPPVARKQPLRSARGSILPQHPDRPASAARLVNVPRPPAHRPPAGPAAQEARDTASPALPKSDAAPAELTSREVEVARLVAKGLSTEEIASELALTRATVVGYLRTLRTKAGADSMEALTSWARAKYPPSPRRPAGERQSGGPRQPTAQAGPHRPAGQSAGPAPAKPSSKVPTASEKPTPPAVARRPPAPRPRRPGADQQMPDLAALFNDPSSPAEAPGRPARHRTPGTPGPDQYAFFFNQLARQDTEAARLTSEGEAHLQAGRDREAMQAFDLALSRQPQNVPALVGRAEARRRTQQLQAALGDLELALSLQPKDARALQVRSETNRDAGRKFRAWADRIRARRRKESST